MLANEIFESNDVLQWEDLSPVDKYAIKLASEHKFEVFLRVFFELIEGQKFLWNWHHRLMCDAIESVYRMETIRLILNLPPGATKTEIFSIFFMVWGIMKCQTEGRSSRWFPMSYSADLVKTNTERAKSIIESEPYMELWTLRANKSTKAKDNWEFKDRNGNRHVCYGTSIGGQVTGRRAGFMTRGFTGALMLDDPISPTMAESALKLATANRRINRVCRSRLARDSVPIVMIQQRVAVGDTTDFMMSDKMPDTFDLIKIPALVGRDYIRSLPKKLRRSCLKDTQFKGERVSYWPFKEPTSTLLNMEKADNYMFSAQYQQEPDEAMLEGMVYRKQLEKLEAERRLCHIPIEKSIPVYTFWDLGINDNMAIWLMQPFGKELRLIACYGNRDEGMEHYINWLLDFKDQHQIRFEEHMAPHDIEVRDLMSGTRRTDIAKRMGISFTTVERCKSKRDSIQSLKDIFDRLFIDKVRCDTDISGNHGPLADKTGLKALKGLRREWDHQNECHKDDVVPKWATNYTDALQQMALYYKEKPKPQQSTRSNRRTSWMSN